MTPVNLSRRDEQLLELMDDPNCDPQRLNATLRRFGLVNRLISGWDLIYRRRLRGILTSLDRPARVLDLGSGGGDVLARLAELAARDGIAVDWTGADPDPRAHEAARARAEPGISFLCADADELISRGESFDVVLSNHVLHHLSAAELQQFTAASRQLCSGTVMHTDIARGRLAYGLYSVAITPLAPGTFLRTDGLRSIRRSYQRAELASALGPDWDVSSPAPFRLLAQGAGHV
ncbi:2-polyprenyl-3-methyl-5-hydroxy-6-metoxy-1,4-benzoquinol methylase [Nesterenkonia lutea]|uniref:2-polyprenyl-3-methyl-5-hydroxy-6-metoxy-1, 4-benzoquinol methylase n=1 Tax=Nesterenkonia lutea TaxID=272919 RepID=A0ABR9JHF0_9MICC|nr:methyltransferase domain-containing protein [Nesterenkonia lutea]MBE1525368.1 2-polyprenyl-3-methyl-5-hydroxy-6-metoxy-1,4-benzoquinol methylase [Nesterenkonia lutea]